LHSDQTPLFLSIVHSFPQFLCKLKKLIFV
jgi:hypothetical protein